MFIYVGSHGELEESWAVTERAYEYKSHVNEM